jgi:hypothetical protein
MEIMYWYQQPLRGELSEDPMLLILPLQGSSVLMQIYHSARELALDKYDSARELALYKYYSASYWRYTNITAPALALYKYDSASD